MGRRVISVAINGIGFLCAGAALAQARGGGAESADQAVTHAVGLAVLGCALPVVGWLLNRSVKQNDTSIKAVSDRLDSLAGKLDRVLETFGQLDKKVALVEQARNTDHEELRGVREKLHDLIDMVNAKLGRFAAGG